MTNQAAVSVASRVLSSPALVETAILRRQLPGARDEYGDWIAGSTTETTLYLVTVPVTGEERVELPEGLREREVRKFWTQADASAIVAGESGGDLIEHYGIEYRAIMVEDWGGFRQIIAVRPEARA